MIDYKDIAQRFAQHLTRYNDDNLVWKVSDIKRAIELDLPDFLVKNLPPEK